MESSYNYNLPTREECYALLKEYELPNNIIRHTELVNKISVFLARRLKQAGIQVDIDMVDRASLLHDLDKMLTLKSPNHGKITEKILIEKGYPEVGKIAKLHGFEYIKEKDLPWEAKIINYADKRVMHDQLSSLRDRLDEAWSRYEEVFHERDSEADKKIFEVEKEIFDIIKLKPEDIKGHIKS